jgi:hypothetical protein
MISILEFEYRVFQEELIRCIRGSKRELFSKLLSLLKFSPNKMNKTTT